jgi:sporulation protein YlmC with PRC-barrel domain
MRANILPGLIIIAAAFQITQVKAQTPGDVTSAAKSAVETLTSAAQDKLLVKDMLGADVSGPDGKTIGTVENFVVIPGGRIVAAIIATDAKDTSRIPVPFSLVKVTRTAGKLGLTLPVGLSELKGMKEIQTLAAAIPGMK